MPPFGAEVFPAVMQHVQFFQADRPSFVELRLNKIQYGRRALAEQDVSTGLPEAVLRRARRGAMRPLFRDRECTVEIVDGQGLQQFTTCTGSTGLIAY